MRKIGTARSNWTVIRYLLPVALRPFNHAAAAL
jgi:hypothetical protein